MSAGHVKKRYKLGSMRPVVWKATIPITDLMDEALNEILWFTGAGSLSTKHARRTAVRRLLAEAIYAVHDAYKEENRARLVIRFDVCAKGDCRTYQHEKERAQVEAVLAKVEQSVGVGADAAAS